ncbi:MAG: transcriptional regulator [Bacteroidetes bacterium]|nr:MAG: transcriptional regulator [Bacteroidota bacterium]
MKNNVKIERTLKGLTQQGLAEIIGVSRQSIVAIEQGKYVPSTVLALKLARCFDKNVDDVFELEEND